MHHFMNENRDVPPFCFAILGLPILLFLLSDWLVPAIGVPLLGVRAEDLLIADRGYVEAAGRNRFLGAMLFFGMTVLISVIWFVGEILRPLTLRTRVLAVAVLIAAQVPVIANAVSHQEESIRNWRSYHQLGDGVMEAVLSHGDVRKCQDYVVEGEGDTKVEQFVTRPEKTLFFGRPCTENPGYELFRFLLDFVTILSGLGVASLVLGMILSLSRLPDSISLEQRALDHGRNQRAARRFLYLAGVMLSAGMFMAMSWMHWPMPMIDSNAHPAYADVINATLFYYGVFYTLLIMTGFGPVMWLATRRSDRLAIEALVAVEPTETAQTRGDTPKAPTVSQLDDWKSRYGLRVSMTEAVQALIATGSPLLTAFAGSFAPV